MERSGNMKTVKQISAELNVSVQTVYRTLNAVKRNTNESLTDKIKNVTYLTEIGERLIKDSLTQLNNVKQLESSEVLFLREQINNLNAEKAELLKQIDKLTTHAENLSRLNENSQILLAQQKVESLSFPTPEKVSLWNKLFKRKN